MTGGPGILPRPSQKLASTPTDTFFFFPLPKVEGEAASEGIRVSGREAKAEAPVEGVQKGEARKGGRRNQNYQPADIRALEVGSSLPAASWLAKGSPAWTTLEVPCSHVD